jgi:spermidine synthase
MIERVQWLQNEPDGLLTEKHSQLHRLLVMKAGSEIRLYFSDPSVHSQSTRMSGRMSELELGDPLFPFVPYTQGMMLSLLWKDQPKRVYTIGFGAGRVPSILHAFIPGVVLESTDIDRSVLPIAERFFGYIPDERQKVFIQDGREYLEQVPAETRYDFIHVDAFRGFGHTAFHLGTVEFYELCKRHLGENGVVCTNMVETDPLFRSRITTMASAFRHCYLFVHEDATVLFGSDAPRLESDELVERAGRLQDRYHFTFPVEELAAKVIHLDQCQPYLQKLSGRDVILTDSEPPAELSGIPETDPMFHNIGRNEPCPCGSGKKFKKCHER